MFHQKVKTSRSSSLPTNSPGEKWVFNFKFINQRVEAEKCDYVNAKIMDTKKRRLTADDDIHYNPHEGVWILQVICPNYMTLQSTMGLVLTKASQSVSGQGMSYHKLRLCFDQTLCSSTGVGGEGAGSAVTLVLDPVLHVCILPWWHPRFASASGTS